jgi:hypothetical protein
MEKTITVSYEGGIAHYKVYHQDDGNYQVHLLRFNGNPDKEPPREFSLHKDGRIWVNEKTDEGLVEEIGKAIEQEPGNTHGPTLEHADRERDEKRKADGGKP